ncbi:MAG: DUF1552 domain-containing protein [Planctomycetia bacterium]|jgi:hypothetical protein
MLAAEWPSLETPDLNVAPGIPQDWEEHCRLLCDLIVRAFQADITRISTCALANELTSRKFPAGRASGCRNSAIRPGCSRTCDGLPDFSGWTPTGPVPGWFGGQSCCRSGGGHPPISAEIGSRPDGNRHDPTPLPRGPAAAPLGVVTWGSG